MYGHQATVVVLTIRVPAMDMQITFIHFRLVARRSEVKNHGI
jgi:hypothetical protein